jgi:hypothetical protein
MSDIKIADAAALTRSLDEFRHLDQEQRALTDRMAGDAAHSTIDEEKKSVEDAEKAIADREEEEQAKREARERERKEREEEKPPPMELDEGHILDLKA